MSKGNRSIHVHECYSVPGPTIAFYSSRSKMIKDLKSKGCTVPELDSSFDATTFDCQMEDVYVIVVLAEFKQKYPLEYKLSCLCHEAVHVAYRHFEHIGESSPSEEEMAYTVQGVSDKLIELYLKSEKITLI